MPSTPLAPTAPAVLVVCLCAQWCNVCRDYGGVFDGQAAAFAGQARFAWLDVEDEDALMGPVEVENFPTLLIGGPAGALFLGPLPPQAGTLARLVQSAVAADLPALPDAQAQALMQRVKAWSAKRA
jgi:thioredoxin 1